MEERVEKIADEQDSDQSSRDPHREAALFRSSKK
jgi:hypothetical protein